MGGEDITVVGRHRGSNRFITIDMPSRLLCDWRTELVYNPHITRILSDRGEYVRPSVENKLNSEQAKDWANAVVVTFNRQCGATGAPRLAQPGPYPEIAKAVVQRYGPFGLWTPMPPRRGERLGPREFRFTRKNTLTVPARHTREAGIDPVTFRWRLAEPGLLRFRTVSAEEHPHGRDMSEVAGWTQVAYEFRLIITPTAAFEALAEVGRDGFWLSPPPLLWAGPPFRLAP